MPDQPQTCSDHLRAVVLCNFHWLAFSVVMCFFFCITEPKITSPTALAMLVAPQMYSAPSCSNMYCITFSRCWNTCSCTYILRRGASVSSSRARENAVAKCRFNVGACLDAIAVDSSKRRIDCRLHSGCRQTASCAPRSVRLKPNWRAPGRMTGMVQYRFRRRP